MNERHERGGEPILYGPDGRLLEDSGYNNYNNPGSLEPGLRGGWRYASSLAGSANSNTYLYGVDRRTERLRARSLYFTNGLFGSAVEVCVAFLVGDDFSHGTMDDKTAQLALEEFWQQNDLGDLADRWMTEFFLDGENATVFPAEDIGRDTPAKVGYLDVQHGVDLTYTTQDGVTAIEAPGGNGQSVTYDAEHMVWTAHMSLWNDPRGWPVAMRAADAAQAYTQLLNHRINTHELQARILGVYKAFVNTQGRNAAGVADGGLYEWQQKANTYRNLPKRGGVLTLAMDPATGNSEELNFMTPANGSGNAETDARALLRLCGLAMGGLPEHWLGEGGNTNRATAGEMSTPAVRIAGKRQAVFRTYLNKVFRLELKRRFGPDKKYTVKSSKLSADGLSSVITTRRVTADYLEMPWELPTLTQDALADVVTLVQTAAAQGLASPQTLSARLGFDSSDEAQRLAALGKSLGQSNIPPAAPPGGDPNVPPVKP